MKERARAEPALPLAFKRSSETPPSPNDTPQGEDSQRSEDASGLRQLYGPPIEMILSRLDGVRRSGRGWQARCPSHEDRHASLSISEGDDRRVLLHDHAGCDSGSAQAAWNICGDDAREAAPRHAP